MIKGSRLSSDFPHGKWTPRNNSDQFSSAAQSCLTLCHPMDCSTSPYPSTPTPGVHSKSCPLRQRCHPTISSSAIPFSFLFESFPASGSFQMSQFFASGSQSTGVSTSASVLPMNIKDWFPLGWLIWSPWGPRDSQESSPTPVQKHKFFHAQVSLWSNSHPYTTTGKSIASTRRISVGKVMSLLFNMLSRLSWETLGWMKHKLESRLLGEISIISDMHMTPSLWQKVKN